MREPFWWPMNEPPLPVDRDRSANRVEVSPNGVGFLRRINPRDDLRMERPDLLWEKPRSYSVSEFWTRALIDAGVAVIDPETGRPILVEGE